MLMESPALQVAMNRFIDDVSVLAIEDCLISEVSGLLRSSQILKMGPETISRLAGETAESSVERKRLERSATSSIRGCTVSKVSRSKVDSRTTTKWNSVSSEDGKSNPTKNTPSSEKAATPIPLGRYPL